MESAEVVVMWMVGGLERKHRYVVLVILFVNFNIIVLYPFLAY